MAVRTGTSSARTGRYDPGVDTIDLAAAWSAAEASVPASYQLCGVVYNGPEREAPWVAFLCHVETGLPGGPEGTGVDPAAALQDLIRVLGAGSSN